MSSVGGWSTFGVCEPQNSKERVGRLVYIICLQVPPCPPKEIVERLSLFLSFWRPSTAQNRVKPLWFLHFRNPKGCFAILHLFTSIHRYCQPFLLFWMAFMSAHVGAPPNEHLTAEIDIVRKIGSKSRIFIPQVLAHYKKPIIINYTYFFHILEW